jgi:hypothetical protein
VRAGLAAILAAFAGASHAIVYDLNYDPVGFFGNGQVTIDAACLATDGTYSSSASSCSIDLVFAYAHDSGHGNWQRGPLADIADDLQFVVANHELVSFDSTLISLLFTGFDPPPPTLSLDSSPQLSGCRGGDLQFYRSDNVVTFNGCAGPETGTYTLQRAPEPATGALLIGALGGAWFARRRRRQP